MAVRWDIFLKQKHEGHQVEFELRTLELYDFVVNDDVRYLFAFLHYKFNYLFNFLFNKMKVNNYYNASQSRELIDCIKLYKDMKKNLSNTENDFHILKDYEYFIIDCESFLESSGGSVIPKGLPQIELIEYEPIFDFDSFIKINTTSSGNYQLKLIGEGSYAKVFIYKDEFYQENIIIKRAKDNLDAKELVRFKKEYEVMKELNSPYVLKVYRYDEINNEYYAEYADFTIDDYISRNNNKLFMYQRVKIINQIFNAFKYIHSKGYLHRDISFSNVLLKQYEDELIVKISDFGLVKEESSTLTSLDSEVKGSLNDSNLQIIGFSNYSIEYETFALTRLIMFILSGKSNLNKIHDEKLIKFVKKGTSQKIDERFKSIEEMKKEFINIINN